MPPLERLRQFACGHRQMALRHPNASIRIPCRRFNTERSFSQYEAVLEAFRREAEAIA